MITYEIKASIIIPVYNTAEYLWECLESVFAQTLAAYEVIAIDDGSTDNSLKVLYDIKKKYPNLIIISQNNKGLGATRNVGLKIARGDYVYFLDSDDVIEPVLLERCGNYLCQNECDFIGFQAHIFGDIEGKDPNQYRFEKRYCDIGKVIQGEDFFIEYHNRISLLNTPLLIFNKRFLKDKNLYFMEDVLHEDVEFYYRMIAYNPRFMIIGDVLYHRRYRKYSIMTNDESDYRLNCKIRVYLAISKILNEKLYNLYAYDVLKEIRKTLSIIYTGEFRINNILMHNIKEYLDSLVEKKNINDFLCQCELFLCYKYLNYLCSEMEINRFVFDRLKKMLCEEDKIMYLYDKNSWVGIYGTGGIADLFIEVCNDIYGEFKAKVIYIDTFCITGEKWYRDGIVTNVDDIDLKSLKSIIVASELYEKDILLQLDKRNAINISIAINRNIISK